MDLQAFRDVATRLQPLRRILNDLTLAADLAVQANAEHVEKQLALEALRTQVEALRAEAADLEGSRPARQAKVDAQLADLQAAYEARAQELHTQMKATEADCATRTKRADAEADAAERDKDALLDMLAAEEQKAQAKLDATKAAYEAFLASVKIS